MGLFIVKGLYSLGATHDEPNHIKWKDEVTNNRKGENPSNDEIQKANPECPYLELVVAL
jgi:hypothetical protein